MQAGGALPDTARGIGHAQGSATEEHELEVLEGARAMLDTAEVIVSEVSVGRRHARLILGQFLSAVERRGFALIDIAEVATGRRGGPIAYLDAVFARRDSRLRH